MIGWTTPSEDWHKRALAEHEREMAREDGTRDNPWPRTTPRKVCYAPECVNGEKPHFKKSHCGG